MTIIIDLSKGWDKKEIDKMIKSLPCSKKDKEFMEKQNQGDQNDK